ncbi:MAG TPA: hypothetical protein VFF68_06615 [Anaerolineaceae bacterium]|nr:hypothetical protein [Anaerolineaceae bacterium]
MTEQKDDQNSGKPAARGPNEKGSPYPPEVHDEAVTNTTWEGDPILEPEQELVYQQAMEALNRSGVFYTVGASFARHAYTCIWRPTKDLDVFLKPEDLRRAMDALEAAGFETEVKSEHWLAKAWKDNYFIDLVFGQGHGHYRITDESFAGSHTAEVLGVQTRLIPVEEMIASEAYIATRNRFDGGEIVHLIRDTQGRLNWQRILDRLGENRALLLWHLILFDFVYPGHADYLPQDIMVQLFDEVRRRWESAPEKTNAFRGMLLDPFSFNVDISDRGYEDIRILKPLVNAKGELV